jgi:hypothetical protein
MTVNVAEEMRKVGIELEKMNEGIISRVKKAVAESAISVKNQAKDLMKNRDDESVKGEPPRVQTGNLIKSIEENDTSEGEMIRYTIGTNVEYGKTLEFGLDNRWPHPFMRPALALKERFSREHIENAIKEAVKAAGSD